LTREQPTRKQKRRRPLWRRLLRGTLLALVWTLIIALIVVAATIDILRKPGGRAFLRDQVLAQTKAMLPGLRIAHIGGSYTDSLLLEGVRLDDRDGKPALGLERLRLLFEPTALGDRTVHVKLIELYRPRITLEKRADGSFNLQHLVVPQKETKKEEPKPKKKKAGAPWSVQLDRLAIVDAQIELPAELVPVGVASHKSDKPGRRLIRLSLDAKLAIKDEHELSADIRLKIDRVLRRAIKLALNVSGSVQAPRAKLDLALGDQGALRLEGGADLRSTMRYDAALDLKKIAVAELLAPLFKGNATQKWLPKTLTASLRLRGRGTPLSPKSGLSGSFTLQPLTVGPYRLTELSLAASTKDQHWTLKKLALAVGRRKSTTLTLSGSGTKTRYKAKLALVSNLWRLPLPTEAKALKKGLGGTITLSLNASGATAGPHRAKLGFKAKRLSIAGMALSSLRLESELDGLPKTPAGFLTITAGQLRQAGKLLVNGARVTLRRKRPDRPLLLSIDGTGPQDTKADVALALKLPANPANVTLSKLSGSLDALDVSFRGQRIKLDRRLALRYRARRPITLPKARFSLLGGNLELEGRFALRSFPRAHARLVWHRLKIPFVKALSGLRTSGTLVARAARKKLSLDLRTRLSHRNDSLRLELAASLPARYRRGKPFPAPAKRGLDARVKISGDLKVLTPLSPDLGLRGRIELDLRARGVVSAPQLALAFSGDGLQVAKSKSIDLRGNLSVGAATTKLWLRTKHAGAPLLSLDAKVGLDLHRLTSGKVSAARLMASPLEVRLRLPQTKVATLASLHPAAQSLANTLKGRLGLELDASGNALQPSLRLETTVAGLRVAGQRANLVVLNLEASATDKSSHLQADLSLDQKRLLRLRAKSALHVRRLLSKKPRLLSAPMQAKLVVAALPLQSLARNVPALVGTAGTLRLMADASGTASSPRGKLSLRLDGARYQAARIGNLELEGSYDGGPKTARVRFALMGVAKGKLAGHAALSLGKKPFVDAAISSRRFRLGRFIELVPAVRELQGYLDMALAAKGPLTPDKDGAPRVRVSGWLQSKLDKLRLFGTPRFTGVETRIELSPSGAKELTVKLARLGLKAGRGRVDASGEIKLSRFQPQTVQLTLQAKDAALGAGAVQGIRTSGILTVNARKKGNRLLADVAFKKGDIRLPKSFGESRSLLSASKLPDVVFVDEASVGKKAKGKGKGKHRGSSARALPKKKTAAKKKASLMLVLRATAPAIQVRSEQLDVEVFVDKILAKSGADGVLRLSGEAGLRRGFIEVLGTRYRVEESRIIFNGGKEINPSLDINVRADLASYRVFVRLKGTAKKPRLVLESTPELDRSQILSLIMTGRIDPRKGGEDDSDKTSMVTAALAQAALGQIFSRLAPLVGLDVMKVRLQDVGGENGQAVRGDVEVGKYIGRRVYLGYRHRFGATIDENANEGIFEFRISTRWLLSAIFGDAGVGGADLLWSYRY
jgi:autotransporter translocation and assembly factor TamB